MKRLSVFFQITLYFFVFVFLITAAANLVAQDDTAVPPPSGLLTSNGIWIETGLPLPVFRLSAPQVTGDGSVRLAANFSALSGSPAEPDSYLGRSRFTVLNEATNSVLEQYGATGGFYAFNPTEAFGETPRGPIDSTLAQRAACLFLKNNQMFPDNTIIGTPNVFSCDYDFSTNPYNFTLINASSQGATSGSATNPTADVIGAIVQVPMFVNTGPFSQIPEVPLGGAGGHISLLFRTTNVQDTGFSLDDSVVGLGAVAMPFYNRSATFIDNFPTRDPAAARDAVITRVQESFPGASNINVPDPALLYMVNDAAQPQTGLEPMLSFSGIEVTTGGETIILRDIVEPALEGGSGGFGPDVAITSPADGSSFTPGNPVNLTGAISAGAAPYTYTWSLNDGAVVLTGTLGAAGNLNATANDLQVDSHDGYPANVAVLLEVEDSNGAVRQAAINLIPTVAPSAYLPIVPNGTAALFTRHVTSAPAAVTAVYRFGVEAGSDYPPYGAGGPDLGGVIPDASGFRSSMLAYGWSSSFNWWNASAWERDWRDCSLGGGDCTYGVDRVDFAYYAGHGGAGGLSLPSSTDSSWFPGSNARFQTLRWVGFASCQTLRAQWPTPSTAPIRQWFNAFQGAHMLLGFNSNMADVAFGPRLVDNMRMPSFLGITFPWAQRTIREAWVQTAFNMNAGKPAYIYAIGTNSVNPADNKLPFSGDPALARPYPVASYHWVWWDE
ncbi:MAG: hypothetical protein KA362_08985 [Chloroflexi bacterium]|nr:hypothetical protein [Chloroflexota bacterium]